ncbi:hypothetical protein [Parvicella tangerina]|uniref:Uncharacterized protein n=1 Tax=Parvicella tangerina TaxID=2829795 RepID=A0A916JMR1_9FLAO|nr:hypothetical protein [Parvicella tangerina]CAG5082320.1 hypothetical protein CRYO30217_01877 [Parvicella tangerina]
MKNLALVLVVALGAFFMILPGVNAFADNAAAIESLENNDGDPEKKCDKCGEKCTDKDCTAKCKKGCTKEDCKKECTKDAKSCSKENCKKGSCDKSKCSHEEGKCKKSCTHKSEKTSDAEKC